MSFRTFVTISICTGLSLLSACGGGGSGGGDATGATLTGTMTSFQASVNAAASSVIVSIGSLSTQTSADGTFTLNNIPAGDQTVVFSEGGSSASYALNGVAQDETFTLDDVQVSGSTITTRHTGTWTGTISSSDSGFTLPMTATIAPNTNAFTAEATNGTDVWNVIGTENGTVVSGTVEVTAGPCTGDGATFQGTFSGDAIAGTYTAPGGTCSASTGEFQLTKS